MRIVILLIAMSLMACAQKNGSTPKSEEVVSSPPAPQPVVAEKTPEVIEEVAEPEPEAVPEPEPAWTEAQVAEALNPAVQLPESLKNAFAEVELDPFPEALVLDAHYWVSNENHHYLYKPFVDEHRGIYLGVGTDQNYLIAAWSKSPILLMFDFDEQIRNVHDIYGSIFRRVENPKDFLKTWTEEEKIAGWIAEDFPEERAKALQKSLKISRKSVLGRLRLVVREYRERKVDTFLTDQEQYDFIRNLWLNNRVFAYRGDLTADKTMKQIAKVLKDHQLSLGLVYLSNAEQYFDFTPQFRRNIIDQPFDEKALILRTRPWEKLGYPEGGRYHYNVQNAQNFAEWMKVHRVKNASRLLVGWRTNDPEILGVSELKRTPRPSKTPPEIAPE